MVFFASICLRRFRHQLHSAGHMFCGIRSRVATKMHGRTNMLIAVCLFGDSANGQPNTCWFCKSNTENRISSIVSQTFKFLSRFIPVFVKENQVVADQLDSENIFVPFGLRSSVDYYYDYRYRSRHFPRPKNKRNLPNRKIKQFQNYFMNVRHFLCRSIFTPQSIAVQMMESSQFFFSRTGTDWKWLAIGGHARNVLVWRINSAYARNIHKSFESYALCMAIAMTGDHQWRFEISTHRKTRHKTKQKMKRMMMWKSLRTMLDLIRFTMLVKANTLLVRFNRCVNKCAMDIVEWVCVCVAQGQWMNHDIDRKTITFSIIHSHFFVRHIIVRIWSNIWRRI